MNRFSLLLILISLCFSKIAIGQVDSLNSFYTKSINAYKAGDYKQYLFYTKKFNDIHPSHPSMTYNLASAYALNGNFKEAEKYLLRALFINSEVDYQEDPDFHQLKNSKTLKNLNEHQNKYSNTINTGNTLEFDFPEILHGETIEFAEGFLIIGTVREPSIYAYSLQDEKRLIRLLPYDVNSSLYAFTSLFFDHESKLLWTTSVAMPQVANYKEANKDKGEILGMDLNGRIVHRHEYFGYQIQDIIKAGNKLLVSDGLTGNIYEVKPSGELEVLVKIASAFNLQSMAYDGERRKLYVADYIRGIYVIDMENGKHTLLKEPEDHMVLKGIDGLEFYEGSLYAIHNGVTPKRVVQYELGRNKIKRYRILEQNIQHSGEPTSGAIGKGKLYYIANSPWDAYDKQEWVPARAQPLQIRYLQLKQ